MSASPKRIKRRLSQRPEKEGWRRTLYDIIFEADTPPGFWFDVCLLLAILASITTVSLETVESLQVGGWTALFGKIEWILTGLFTIEYACRLSCSRRPLRYVFSFWGVIDLLSILPSYLAYFADTPESFVILRSVRLLRVFRVLKLWRMMNEADELAAAIWNARDKIIVFLTVVLVAITISGALMYHIENEWGAPPSEVTERTAAEDAISEIDDPLLSRATSTKFTSIPQSMYWAIVTMTTVGYGDISPETTLGKIIASALILLGYSLIIVPSAFVSAEIMHSKQPDGELTCPSCDAKGHHHHAVYCYRCAGRLDD